MYNDSNPDTTATTTTRSRYQRIAPVYELMEALPELLYTGWRKRLTSFVIGAQVLEVGVGTGKNLPFYREGLKLTAIDLTPGMLIQAEKRAHNLGLDVDLRIGDVQRLEFPDNYFDTALATFVFCSVPDPVLGLKEITRVVKSGGIILLLEHVRSDLFILGPLMDVLNPFIVNTMGPNINRCTIENIKNAGIYIENVEDLGYGDIFKFITARKRQPVKNEVK